MVPLVREPLPSLDGVPLLADLLGSAGAEVTLHGSVAGHGLTREDLEMGERWMHSVAAHR